MTYVNRDDPACCQICGTWLREPQDGQIIQVVGGAIHEQCEQQMLADEWMAERASEEYELAESVGLFEPEPK